MAKIFSPPQRQLRRVPRHDQIAERGADDSLAQGVPIGSASFCSTRAASIFRPTKICSRSRAGPVKDGRVFRGHPPGLGLDWPEHGGTIDKSGRRLRRATSDHQFQTGGFQAFSHRPFAGSTPIQSYSWFHQELFLRRTSIAVRLSSMHAN